MAWCFWSSRSFPNGRLAPFWAVGLVALYAASALLSVFLPGTPAAINTWPIPLTGSAWFGLVVLLALAQAYRYWRVSSLVQRQQTKWIVLGVAAAVVGGGFWVPDLLFVSLRQPGSVYQALLPVVNFIPLLIPLTIGFSILRYRLWAIDTHHQPGAGLQRADRACWRWSMSLASFC